MTDYGPFDKVLGLLPLSFMLPLNIQLNLNSPGISGF